MTMHETLPSIHSPGSSDRAFGLVFSAFFAVIAFLPLAHSHEPRWWALGVAIAFLIAAAWVPGTLRPLNRLWTSLGLLLGKATTPIVLAILFYVVVTPIGIIMRMAGKDPLRLKHDVNATSYWIAREGEGPDPKTMKDQF